MTRLTYLPLLIGFPLAFLFHPSFGPLVGEDAPLGQSLGIMMAIVGLTVIGMLAGICATMAKHRRLAENVKSCLLDVCSKRSSAQASFIVKEEFQRSGKHNVRVMYIEVSSVATP